MTARPGTSGALEVPFHDEPALLTRLAAPLPRPRPPRLRRTATLRIDCERDTAIQYLPRSLPRHQRTARHDEIPGMRSPVHRRLPLENAHRPSSRRQTSRFTAAGMWRVCPASGGPTRGRDAEPHRRFSSSSSSRVSARSSTAARSPSGIEWRNRSWARRSFACVSFEMVTWSVYSRADNGVTSGRARWVGSTRPQPGRR
jgi:hypothetical protein